MNDEVEEFAPLWDHFAELRAALLRVLLFIAIGVACSLFFYQDVIQLLTLPLKHEYSQLLHQEIRHEIITNPSQADITYSALDGRPFALLNGAKEISPRKYLIPPGGALEINRMLPKNQLLILGPLDGMLISLKASLWVGLIATSPAWIFFLLKFIYPALRKREKRLLIPFLTLSFVFISLGILFSHFITIPLANSYLQTFNLGIGLNLWTLSNYIDYTFFLMLANAIAFELGIVLLLLVHCGVLKADWMRSKRRHMIVLAFILGALLTPPDILTQFMLAIPLIGLYECAILYARVRQSIV